MEGLCLLLAALSAAAPGRGPASGDAAAATTPAREGTPPFGSAPAPTEPTAPPGTSGVAGNTSVAPSGGAVRLAGGRTRCEGRVELERAGAWGTVCDDAWDLADGDVACRQLECGRALRIHGGAAFGRGGGPILLDEVGCEGHEENLWDCPAAPEHDCNHKEDAGVVCSEHQEWRLAGGWDGCAGRVEVFYRGVWSTVCDSTWYEPEGRVLCRSLGCGEYRQRLSFAHTLPGKVVYQCESQHASLAHCKLTYNKSGPCQQSRAVGVICNGSQGLQMPTVAAVTPSNVTVLSAEEGSVAGTPPPLHVPLFVLCLVLAALLLLTVLAFTAALLRVRKTSAHTVSPLGLAGPVLVTHSAQSPDVPSGTSNDYREMPPNLPKGPDPPVTAHPTAKDSDSDYEHYDFSSKPPVALSTFHNSLRRQPGEQLLPLMPNQDGTGPFPAPARLGPPSRSRARSSSTSSSSSSTEPYCNDSTTPTQAWVCPPDPADGTHRHAAPATRGCTGYLGTATPPSELSQPWVSPAAPDPADSSSTSSGEWYEKGQWYENVQGTKLPTDPSPHPGWPAPSCPSGGHEWDPNSSEGSDYDDIQGSAS